MTPQEKAKEMLSKFYIICQEFTEEIQCSIQAQQCALIAVDEVLSIKKEIWDDFHREYFEYWQKVKAEIEKL
jgi:hypothetical protein